MAKQQVRECFEHRCREALETFSYGTAAFYADKLVSLSGGQAGGVFLLARVHFASGEFARALHVLRRHGVVPRKPLTRNTEDPRPAGDPTEVAQCIHLAARCAEQLKQYSEALEILSSFDHTLGADRRAWCNWPLSWDKCKAAAYCTAGRCNWGLERHVAARACYQLALQADPFHFEALDLLLTAKLTDGPAAERDLVEACVLQGETGEVVRELYWSRLPWGRHEGLVRRAGPVSTRDALAGAGDRDIYANVPGIGATGDTPEPLMLPEERQLNPLLGPRDPYTEFCRALRLWAAHYVQSAFACAKRVVGYDPFYVPALMLYATCMTALKMRTELFELGHDLMARLPQSAAVHYVIGCYYYSTGDSERAGKIFSRATSIDPKCVEAWVGYGHTFHALEESDHTMQAYRNASRVAPGSHIPLLYLGMEQSNLQHAFSFLVEAKAKNVHTQLDVAWDPALLNELGVVMYKGGKYDKAQELFLKCLESSPIRDWVAESGGDDRTGASDIRLIRDSFWEPVVVNLAHCARKLRRYKRAIHLYSSALTARPHCPVVLSAIGFTYHLAFRLEKAIEYYHVVLGLKNIDTFCRDMLDRALDELFRLRAQEDRGSPGGRASPRGMLHTMSDDSGDDMPGQGMQLDGGVNLAGLSPDLAALHRARALPMGGELLGTVREDSMSPSPGP
eukprot:TRINITY_DN7003_c0_g1_i1.p1 TRINITY_DN7003_c0_g1~~TRINITY_DN7003_c0_g1_i1.p1  ORF type:complete len:710 (+),score=229.51 TRINITY_DN7003_c0_g1_i1:95-2131(+)